MINRTISFVQANALMFLFFALAAAAGCGMLAELGKELPGDIIETMPPNMPGTEDPVTGGSISPTAFWTTWALTLGAHEARKFLRLLRKKMGGDNGDA